MLELYTASCNLEFKMVNSIRSIPIHLSYDGCLLYGVITLIYNLDKELGKGKVMDKK